MGEWRTGSRWSKTILCLIKNDSQCDGNGKPAGGDQKRFSASAWWGNEKNGLQWSKTTWHNRENWKTSRSDFALDMWGFMKQLCLYRCIVIHVAIGQYPWLLCRLESIFISYRVRDWLISISYLLALVHVTASSEPTFSIRSTDSYEIETPNWCNTSIVCLLVHVALRK